jgi:hypothetical protein
MSFDKRIISVLNEFNPLAVAGQAIKSAENPGQGIADVIGGFKERGKEKEERLKQPFSLKNEPKANQKATVQAPIMGLSKPDKNGEVRAIALQPSSVLYGVVVQPPGQKYVINPQDGSYVIMLTDQNFQPSKEYVFARTEDAPYWQVFSRKVVEQNPNAFIKGADGCSGYLQIYTSTVKNDVSEPLRGWKDYEQHLAQQKK